MKLTVELPSKVFDKLVALAINEYRHAPQQAAYILERHLLEHERQDQSVEPAEVGSRE